LSIMVGYPIFFFIVIHWALNSSIDFLSKMFNCFLSLFVSVELSYAYVKVLSIIVFFIINFSFLDMLLFLKKYSSNKCAFLNLVARHIKQTGEKNICE
jgi:hypothetical protein